MRPVLVLAVLLLPGAVAAQGNADAARARRAYDAADFPAAIVAAQRALRAQLSGADRVATYEVLAYAYAAMDSTSRSQEAFKQLIFLDPNREPNRELVSPRITSLYAAALGDVLVVRHARVDSSSFVAGQGPGTVIRFEVSRSARVTTRLTGPNLEATIDSQVVVGPTLVSWNALTSSGDPLPAGAYQVVVTATEGRNDFAAVLPITVTHGAVDTIPHLLSLPGYAEQPETVRPPRDWRPLGISALIAGVAAGASFALGNSTLSGEKRREVGGASTLVIGMGLFLSLHRPDPQPVEANIRYNRLLREQLAQRNAEIAAQNTLRRRQVRLTVTPGEP